mgnify:FL=1
MLSDQETQSLMVPPRLSLEYESINFVSKTSYYKIYEAISIPDKKPHIIRALDLDSELFQKNPNQATTLFIQELLRLFCINPELVPIQSFESYDGRIAYAMKPYDSLENQIGAAALDTKIGFEKLIKDVIAENEFFLKNLKFNSIELTLQNLCREKATDTWFVSDWGTSTLQNFSEDKKLDLNEQMKKLGFALFQLYGLPQEDIQDLSSMDNPKLYTTAINGLLSSLKVPEKLGDMIRKMTSKDLEVRRSFLQALKDNKEIKPEAHKIFEEVKDEMIQVHDESKQSFHRAFEKL